MPWNLRNRPMLTLTVSLVILFLMSVGCGGGGTDTSSSTGTSTASPKILGWTPPQYFDDQTPLDPVKDLSHYEIHISDTGNFSLSDVTEATVSAVDPKTGQPVSSFDLANLANYIAPNVTYYVSMRSVSTTGVKSDYSPAISFSL
jgi:hypothetical protein